MKVDFNSLIIIYLVQVTARQDMWCNISSVNVSCGPYVEICQCFMCYEHANLLANRICYCKWWSLWVITIFLVHDQCRTDITKIALNSCLSCIIKWLPDKQMLEFISKVKISLIVILHDIIFLNLPSVICVTLISVK